MGVMFSLIHADTCVVSVYHLLTLRRFDQCAHVDM